MPLILGGQEAGTAAAEITNITPEIGNAPPRLEVLDHRLHPELALEAGRGCRARRDALTQVCLHWTAGEPRNVEAFREVLRRRRVGVHFFVDRLGTVWQLADPLELEAYHAGRLVNRRSVGIEVAGYGFRFPARTRWNLLEVPRRGRDREVYETRVAGRRYYFAAFYPVQVQAVTLLVEALVQELPDVDRAVPLEADGSLRTRRLTRKEVRSFSGVLGHLHVPGSRKLDPGTQVLEVLRRRFEG